MRPNPAADAVDSAICHLSPSSPPPGVPAHVRPVPLARHCGRVCRASPTSSTSRAARWGSALTAEEGRASVACAACFLDFVDIERPGPKLSAVHLKDGQPVETGDSCPSIKIPPVGGALDIPHWCMAVHERAQALHRSSPVPANGLPGAGQSEQRHPYFVPAFKQFSCAIPREVRRFRVHDADRAIRRLDGNCEREAIECDAPSRICLGRYVAKPSVRAHAGAGYPRSRTARFRATSTLKTSSPRITEMLRAWSPASL